MGSHGGGGKGDGAPQRPVPWRPERRAPPVAQQPPRDSSGRSDARRSAFHIHWRTEGLLVAPDRARARAPRRRGWSAHRSFGHTSPPLTIPPSRQPTPTIRQPSRPHARHRGYRRPGPVNRQGPDGKTPRWSAASIDASLRISRPRSRRVHPPINRRLTGRRAAHTIRARATSQGGAHGWSGSPVHQVARFDTSTARPHHSTSAPRAVAPRPLHLNN